MIWEFPKIRGTIVGVPIIRTIVFGGLYWGPLILGNYHIYCSIETVSKGRRSLLEQRLHSVAMAVAEY